MKALPLILMLALAALAIPSVSAAPPELPIESHCVNGEFGAQCSTTIAGTCTYSSGTTEAGSSSDLGCSHSVGITRCWAHVYTDGGPLNPSYGCAF